MAIAAPAIKRDLLLSDAQLGLLLGLAFAIFFSLLAFPSRAWPNIGTARASSPSPSPCSALRSRRAVSRRISGSSSSAASAWAPAIPAPVRPSPRSSAITTREQARLGELADLARAPVGAVAGSVLGGLFTQNIGWRYWFFALGVVSLAVAIAAFFTLREPPRGMSDPIALKGPPPSMWTVAKFLWAKKSFRQVLIGAGLAATGMNALGQFFARYFISTFHLGFAEVGAILGGMVTCR